MYSIVCNTTNASNADISMNFKPDNSCVLSFDKSEKIFTNINKLSSELNNITGDYLKVGSINLDDTNNYIVFNNVYNTKPCNITFSSSNSFKPGVILNFGDNKAEFFDFTIEKEISKLGFNYNIPDNVKVVNVYNKSLSLELTVENQPLVLQYFDNRGKLICDILDLKFCIWNK